MKRCASVPTNRFDELPKLHKLTLVLDVRVGQPSLDLISQPLEFLDLGLEVVFTFFLLGRVGGSHHLVVDGLEELDALLDLLERLVDFG